MNNEVIKYAGNLRHYLHKWKGITTDKSIINIVSGYKLKFNSQPVQLQLPNPPTLRDNEINAVNEAIIKLLKIGAISVAETCEGQFISNVFVVPKSTGGYRLVINLKKLNEYLISPHFKMEDFRSVCNIMEEESYMATIDLKDAYHLVPIHTSSRKFLRFYWENTLYEYNCLPFGLATAPRIFTKLLKPVVTVLRNEALSSVIFLDDMLLLGKDKNSCEQNISETKKLLVSLGFLINKEKSQLIPVQEIKYLGFIFCSKPKSLRLPNEKREKVQSLCKQLLCSDYITAESLASALGYFNSVSPAVPYSPLYLRQLEMEKIKCLRLFNNNYNASLKLSKLAKDDLSWWLKTIPEAVMFIHSDQFDQEIYTDSSLSGWGCAYQNSMTRGFWSVDEKSHHINVLELQAILYGLKSFLREDAQRVLIRSDNTTAISYVNKYGGCRSGECHRVATDIWKFCEEKRIWVFASYISSKENVEADALSRWEVESNDFGLNLELFNNICNELGSPTIDLFATRHTRKCTKFYSWFPDPEAAGTDAFTHKWMEYFYAFPPFNMIGRVLRKVIDDKANGIVVVPRWPSQPWFPLFLELCNKQFLCFDADVSNLYSPYSSQPHPLATTMTIIAAQVSGKREN